jgi:hypothetical protein
VAVNHSAVAIGVLGTLAVPPHSHQAEVRFSRNNGHQSGAAISSPTAAATLGRGQSD